MKSILTIAVVFFSLLLFSSCFDEDDSTSVGYLTLTTFSLDSSGKAFRYCFDDITGLGHTSFGQNVCNDTVKYLFQLPLNVAKDTCTYIFRKGTRRDTLKLKYTRKMVSSDVLYKMDFTSLHITYSTFDSLKVKCTSSQSTTCDAKNFTAYIFF